jgi:hypothetical protein
MLVACWMAGTVLVRAEVVEEETWYNASGEVVKTVTRTYTGADADRTPDWEPAWVVRERRAASRGVRYGSRYSSWGNRYYGAYWSGPVRYGGGCYSVPRRSGFSGFYRSGGGGSRWGVSFRSRGLSTHCRW